MKLAEDKGCQLSDLTTQDLQTINKLFEDDVQEVWNFDRYAHCMTLCHAGMTHALSTGMSMQCRSGPASRLVWTTDAVAQYTAQLQVLLQGGGTNLPKLQRRWLMHTLFDAVYTSNCGCCSM